MGTTSLLAGRICGMLYALGSNGHGQLGIGNYDDVSEAQQCILQYDEDDPPGTIKRIAAGGNHTLVLFESGRVFSAGSNVHGQAGIESRASTAAELTNTCATFTEVRLPTGFPKIKLCSVTWAASIIVTSDDEVYSFGNGPKGELGTGIDNSRNLEKLPRIPSINEVVVDIASGIRHTVVVLSDGNVYGWGHGRHAQLGEPIGIVRTPRQIKGLGSMKRVTCGSEFSYVVGEPRQGRHCVLGSDKWGVKAQLPTYMQGWKDIGSNWGGVHALTDTGKLVAWGRNDRGQLDPSGGAMSETFEQIAVGSEHALALTSSGRVLAWGWGEHGNCGPRVDENGNVKGEGQDISPSLIDASASIVGIAAGCATSFMWTAFEHLS